MPAEMHGFGSRYYGKCQFRDDDTYVTTEWFVLLYFPLIPLGSYRVSRDPDGDRSLLGFHSFSYDIVEQLPINWPQVGRVYLFIASVTLWSLWLLYAAADTGGFFSEKGSVAKALLWIFLFVVPWLIKWWLRWYGAKESRGQR